MSKINKQDQEKICDLYKNGSNTKDIAKIFNIHHTTVCRILNRNNINLGRDSSYDDEIIKYYNQGLSTKKIANILNIGNKKVVNALKSNNIEMRTYSEYRTHKINESIFEIIDNEEKAYWLGFLYADGYINNIGWSNHIQLALSNKDIEHLEKFKLFLNCDYEIKHKESTNSCHLNMTSKKIVSDLINLGCVQAKSLILQFPTTEQVPEHLMHHFMRGYFDGDGCVSLGRGQLRFEVVGNSDFLDRYESIILDILNKENPNKRRPAGNAEVIRYAGNKQVQKIYNFLYKDATIYLDRKFNKFNMTLPSQDETDK